jgi:type VI secretion system secreted protein VgrG
MDSAVTGLSELLANRTVTAHTPLPGVLAFRGMTGHEGLSQLFEFDVELVAENYSLDIKQLLGKPLTLAVDKALVGQRYLNGQITRCTLVGRESATSRYYIYRATVRPWLWYLTQTSDSKIFQNKSVPDVIKEVLADYAFPMEMHLSSTYRPWEYCVQYQETDFAFISRLMEHEGIYYWFRHEDGRHTLVLTDDVTQHESCPGCETIPYYGPDRTTVPQEEYISSWQPAEQITPGGFATTDFDFKRPAANMSAKRQNPGPYDNGDLEMYEWLGGYTDPEQAEHYARVRLQDLQGRQEQVSGQCNVRELATGYLFTLRNHPRQSENREYLIVSASYRIREGGYASGSDSASLFEVYFVVVPSNVQFRAPRVTPQARTHGPQTATVVGKEGEQIWVDKYGRIKVQFHWDRYGQKNENSSCWVRVSSPWAGGGFGGIQPPRRGDEVVVDFIGGHPDRPIVIGRVYNGSNMPPWELPINATQSGFLSRSKDGNPETANAFMFEDKPGAEQIMLHAERNLDTSVEADETHNVGGSRTTSITGDDTLTVQGARTTTVQGHETETFNSGADRTVTGQVTETINGDEIRVFTGNVTETINGNETRTVNGDWSEQITGTMSETRIGPETRSVTGNVSETITGNETRTITGDWTETITGTMIETRNGSETRTVTGTVTETINGTFTQTVSGAVNVNAPSVTVTTPSWTVSSSDQGFWTGATAHGTGARFNIVGASMDVWGAREQVYALNSQAAAVKYDLSGLKNSGYGLKMDDLGVSVVNAAVKMNTGMVGTIIRTLTLYI